MFFPEHHDCNEYQLQTTTLLDFDHRTVSYLPFIHLPNTYHVLSTLLSAKFKEVNKYPLFLGGGESN